jgi:hypothetical protein
MATCRVLTIRIDTNGAQRSASGAVFLDPAGSIPMIQITFPPVSTTFVRLSVNLPRFKQERRKQGKPRTKKAPTDSPKRYPRHPSAERDT